MFLSNALGAFLNRFILKNDLCSSQNIINIYAKVFLMFKSPLLPSSDYLLAGQSLAFFPSSNKADSLNTYQFLMTMHLLEVEVSWDGKG